MRRLSQALLIVLMMSLLAACKTDSGSQPLLKIGAKVVTQDQLISYMQLNASQMQALQAQGLPQEAIREQVFNQLVLEEVALYEAVQTGQGLESNDIVKTTSILGQASGANEKATYNDIQQFATSRGFESTASIRDFLNRRTALDAYAKHVQTGRAPFVDFHLIKITLPQTPTADVEEQTRLKAESVLERINDGMTFADAALQYSEDQSAQTAGEIGFVDLEIIKSVLGSDTGTMIGNLPLKTPSAVTRGPDGWYIFQVTDYRSFSPVDANQNPIPDWIAMVQDPTGKLYLQTRIEEYAKNGTLQIFPENLVTVPIEIPQQ